MSAAALLGRCLVTGTLCACLAGCASVSVGPAPAEAKPPPPAQDPHVQTGRASWYGSFHQGRQTASGETFDMYELTAAHRTLPLGSRVQVTNLRNGRSVEVRINDRGPIVEGRIIDLSYAAAARIGAVGEGVVPVRLRVLSP